MVITGWLRSHWKSLTIHTIIVGGFLLFLLLAAEPLFDRLERIPGESQLQKVSLPAETGGIRYYIDELSTDGYSAVEIRGWAFIEGEDTEGSKIYVVLKSASRTYVFDTMTQTRKDVTQHFELNLNLDYSGFLALIPARKLAYGEYTIGIYIRKGDIQALHYTDKIVVKARGSLELTLRTSQLQEISLPAESQNIRFWIDSVEQAVTEGRELIELWGWAFIEGKSAENSQIYVVLKSLLQGFCFR